ncbi:MAG: hypothetical protein ACOYMA_17395 [Bacteroidia bacterium]
MGKVIFLADRWVKFQYNNEICIGVSFLQEYFDSSNQIQLVFFVTKELKTDIIAFSQCIDLRYLDFIKKPNNIKEIKITNEVLTLESQIDLIMRPYITRKTIAALANIQCNSINTN